MTYLCLVEAMNLDNLFSDCDDLSTTRGGGLAVLDVGARVVARLSVPSEDAISGASQGLFRLTATDATKARERIAETLDSLALLQHATVFFAVADEGAPEDFQRVLAKLQSDLRWQQMQAPSVVYPALKPGNEICVIDRVRPAEKRPDLSEKSTQSDFSYERRKFGRAQKNRLITEILKTDAASGPYEVADDLNDLASGGSAYGNAADKIAMLRFDGNSFGKKYAELGRFEELHEFSQQIKEQQKGFFRQLLRSGRDSIPLEWWTENNRLRLEIVVYGGDEVTFIVPAWLGWRALETFYACAKGWTEVTYAGAVVFCHHKTPIHSVKKLVSELVDEAKDRGERGNFAMYQVLESFDAIGRDVKTFLDERYKFAAGRGEVLDLEAMQLLKQQMPELRGSLSRRKLHEHVLGLMAAAGSSTAIAAGGKEDFATVAAKLTEDKNVAPVRTRNMLHELYQRLGDAALLHILELWDYVEVGS